MNHPQRTAHRRLFALLALAAVLAAMAARLFHP